MFAADCTVEELMTPTIDRGSTSPDLNRPEYPPVPEHRYYGSVAVSQGTGPTTRLWRRVEAINATSTARIRDMEQSHADEVNRIKSRYQVEVTELERKLLEQENTWKQAYEAAAVENQFKRETESSLGRASLNERVVELELNQQRRLKEQSDKMINTLNTLKEKETLRRSELEQRLLEAERHFEMKAQRYDALVLELRRTIESQRLQYEQRLATLQQELDGRANMLHDRQEALEGLEKELWSAQQQASEAGRKLHSVVAAHGKKEEKWKRRMEKLAMKFAQVQGQGIATTIPPGSIQESETQSQLSTAQGLLNGQSPRWQRGRRKSDYG